MSRPQRSATSRALGAAIRATRTERGLSQEAFAIRAGIDRSYYGAIERGEFNLSIGKLAAIAAGLELPAWELLRRGEGGRDA
jgi:transcriptional regulator with XRE-family HTH domain